MEIDDIMTQMSYAALETKIIIKYLIIIHLNVNHVISMLAHIQLITHHAHTLKHTYLRYSYKLNPCMNPKDAYNNHSQN